MSDLFEPIDATDARLALGATGLLGAFNAAGVLTSADVHVAAALGRLGSEDDERVLLAVALAVRAVRGGSVCVDLATVADPPDLPWPSPDEWAPAVAASPLVAAGLVRWDHDLLYLDRYHEQETQVVDDLLARAATSPDHDPDLMRASLDRVVAAMQAAAVAAGRARPSYDE
jgi:exodeoxyribonuclease V alpha subunit